jgi:hypothetical protein
VFIREALVATAIVIAAVGSASPVYAKGDGAGSYGGGGGSTAKAVVATAVSAGATLEGATAAVAKAAPAAAKVATARGATAPHPVIALTVQPGNRYALAARPSSAQTARGGHSVRSPTPVAPATGTALMHLMRMRSGS